MASGEIHTYFEGTWHQGDVPVMKAGDHGAWLGSTVFDGARCVDGLIPDLRPHLERVNRSAEALMIKPTCKVDDMIELVREGLKKFRKGEAVYIRPMYWALEGNETVVQPGYGLGTGFCIALEAMPMAPADAATTLTRTRFRRPTLDCALTNAKTGSLYPNNGRMLGEARAKGFGNALVTDIVGNVAETATANVFMVKDGEFFTPIANGTFLSGLTRKRHISNLRAAGYTVHEAVLSYEDFETADEVFLSGNQNKVTSVSAFDDTTYGDTPMTQRVRELYWDWAQTDMKL